MRRFKTFQTSFGFGIILQVLKLLELTKHDKSILLQQISRSSPIYPSIIYFKIRTPRSMLNYFTTASFNTIKFKHLKTLTLKGTLI